MKLLIYLTYIPLLLSPSCWWTLLMLPLCCHHHHFSSSLAEAQSVPSSISGNRNSKIKCGLTKKKLGFGTSAVAIFVLASQAKRLKNLFKIPEKARNLTFTSARPPNEDGNSGLPWNQQQLTVTLFGQQLTVRRPLWILSIIAALIVALGLLFKIVQFLFCEEDECNLEAAGGGLRRHYRLLTSPFSSAAATVATTNDTASKRAGGEVASSFGKTQRTKKKGKAAASGWQAAGSDQIVKSVVSDPVIKLPSGSEIYGSATLGPLLLQPVVKSPSGETDDQTNALVSVGGVASLTPPTHSTVKSWKTSTSAKLMKVRHFSNTPMGSMAGHH